VHEAATVADGTDAKAEFNLSLQNGTYHLLALVPGYQVIVKTESFT
jgi:hypothetical protein